MPTNQINIAFTDAQVTEINESITKINEAFPFAINLTKQERQSLPGIDDERYPYVQKVMDNYAPNNANLVTGFAGTLAEAQTDWTLVKQINDLLPKLESLIEKMRDTQQLAASENYTFMLEFYGTAQRAAQNKVPGADAIVDDLKPLFDKQGPQTPPTPPTP